MYKPARSLSAPAGLENHSVLTVLWTQPLTAQARLREILALDTRWRCSRMGNLSSQEIDLGTQTQASLWPVIPQPACLTLPLAITVSSPLRSSASPCS